MSKKDLEELGCKPGDNSKYLHLVRYPMKRPDKVDCHNPEEVARRLEEYLDYCELNDYKPSMIGAANWLGVDRDTMGRWRRGEYAPGTAEPIQRLSMICEQLWVDYMQNGKINPAAGIFLGKNFFNYKDVNETILTPNQGIKDGDPDQIAAKYADALPPADPEQIICVQNAPEREREEQEY